MELFKRETPRLRLVTNGFRAVLIAVLAWVTLCHIRLRHEEGAARCFLNGSIQGGADVNTNFSFM
jgi:hypothetical protein